MRCFFAGFAPVLSNASTVEVPVWRFASAGLSLAESLDDPQPWTAKAAANAGTTRKARDRPNRYLLITMIALQHRGYATHRDTPTAGRRGQPTAPTLRRYRDWVPGDREAYGFSVKLSGAVSASWQKLTPASVQAPRLSLPSSDEAVAAPSCAPAQEVEL